MGRGANRPMFDIIECHWAHKRNSVELKTPYEGYESWEDIVKNVDSEWAGFQDLKWVSRESSCFICTLISLRLWALIYKSGRAKWMT